MRAEDCAVRVVPGNQTVGGLTGHTLLCVDGTSMEAQ